MWKNNFLAQIKYECQSTGVSGSRTKECVPRLIFFFVVLYVVFASIDANALFRGWLMPGRVRPSFGVLYNLSRFCCACVQPLPERHIVVEIGLKVAVYAWEQCAPKKRLG